MSHQDRPCPLVINHQTIKQVRDWLLAPSVFASLRGGQLATWKPRMLAAAAWLWATSELPTGVSLAAVSGPELSRVSENARQMAPGAA